MKELQYRTYDELLAAVLSDFKTFDQEGMIDPQDLIKVAQSINTELSVRINSMKEIMMDVDKGKVRLPNDLQLLNFALLCGSHTVTMPVIRGTHTEAVLLPPETESAGCNTEPFFRDKKLPERPIVRLTECSDHYGIVQHFKYETRTYRYFRPLRIESSSRLNVYCPNTKIHAEQKAYIKGGWLYTSFEKGTLYLNYMGTMEDDEGNLLVLDHPIVNTYYEYALKERILENMLINGEQVGELLKLMGIRRKNARLEAHGVVFTPDFSELKAAWAMNRRKQYEKYYEMFRDIPYAA